MDELVKLNLDSAWTGEIHVCSDVCDKELIKGFFGMFSPELTGQLNSTHTRPIQLLSSPGSHQCDLPCDVAVQSRMKSLTPFAAMELLKLLRLKSKVPALSLSNFNVTCIDICYRKSHRYRQAAHDIALL